MAAQRGAASCGRALALLMMTMRSTPNPTPNPSSNPSPNPTPNGRALALLMMTMRSTSPDSSSSRRKSAKVISCVGVGWALEIGLGVELGLRRFSIGGHLGVAACALRELV